MPALANHGERAWPGSGRAGWHVAALELWTLWQRRPKLRKRTVLFLAWRFVPPNVKLIAVGVASLGLLLFAAAFAALVFGLTQLA
jgi:hypothetical protein